MCALIQLQRIYRKTQKSERIEKLLLHSVDLQSPYIALVDMGMIWRMATPSAEDWHTQDGTLYKWSDCVHKLASIILVNPATNAELQL